MADVMTALTALGVAKQTPPAKSASGFWRTLLWFLTILGSLAGALTLADTFTEAKSAPQQAAGAALGVGLAVIPYCLARAVSELNRRQ
jgi:hypothetical protein